MITFSFNGSITSADINDSLIFVENNNKADEKTTKDITKNLFESYIKKKLFLLKKIVNNKKINPAFITDINTFKFI